MIFFFDCGSPVFAHELLPFFAPEGESRRRRRDARACTWNILLSYLFIFIFFVPIVSP